MLSTRLSTGEEQEGLPAADQQGEGLCPDCFTGMGGWCPCSGDERGLWLRLRLRLRLRRADKSQTGHTMPSQQKLNHWVEGKQQYVRYDTEEGTRPHQPPYSRYPRGIHSSLACDATMNTWLVWATYRIEAHATTQLYRRCLFCFTRNFTEGFSP